MVEKEAIIMNIAGIHCRPSAVIIKKAMDCEATILIDSPRGSCELNSVLELISLGLEQGTHMTISVSGKEEESVCQQMVELFETTFDFPPE